MCVSLGTIAADQAAPTEKTYEKTLYFIDYVSSHPEAILTFKRSSMVLAIHSDASSLMEPKSRNMAGRPFYLRNKEEEEPNNGLINNVTQLVR